MADLLQDQRRAIGDAMVARRTGAASVADINSVIRPATQRRSLRAQEPRGAVPATKGRGAYDPSTRPVGGGGGGIAAPLDEKTGSDGKADRTYYPDASAYYSNDYMLAVVIQPLKRTTMIDALGNEVPFNFAEPAME